LKRLLVECPYCGQSNHVHVDPAKPKEFSAVQCTNVDMGCGKVFLLTTEIVIKKETHKVEGQ